MVTIRSEINNYLQYIALIAILVLVLSLIFYNQSTLIGAGITLTIVIASYLKDILVNRIVEITIEPKEDILRITKSKFLRKKVYQFPLMKVSGQYVDKVGAKGMKIQVFRLEYDNEIITDIMPNYSGFSDDAIEKLNSLINYNH